jgi:glycosyltransferase involved in cell wall biosynthesis
MFTADERKIALLAVHHVHNDGHNSTGGAEKYIHGVIEVLLSAGARVHVGFSGTDIYQRQFSFAQDQLCVERVDWLDEKLSGDGSTDRPTVSDRQAWLARSGADTAFFVQQASGAAFHASVVAARSLGMRVVSSIRQPPAELPHPSRFTSRLPFSWHRAQINRVRSPAMYCDAVIFNSRRIAEAFQQQFLIPPAICHVIYNAERPRPDLQSSRHSRAAVIGTVGRVSVAKGADLLFEAFAAIAKDEPRVRLKYVGDGPESAILKARCAALGLSERVVFAGYVEDRNAIFRDIDLYVQASRRESMSNSVIEAMARGIPCIVTDVGGLPELVLDGITGRVVPPDAAMLSRAIRELLGDPYTCRRFGEAGLDRVSREFSLPRFREQTLHAILG